MKKNLTRIILSFIAFVISIPCFAEDISIPTSLKGNWINTQTNEWEYGLFEKFAVYDCDFWNYTSIVPLKKNVLMINLENGEKSLSIKIKEEKNGTISIESGKKKKSVYKKASKEFSYYPQKDHSRFNISDYRTDSVTITGYFRNFDQVTEEDMRFFRKFQVIIHLKPQKEYNIEPDSLGRFKIRIPAFAPQYIDIYPLLSTVVTPGESLFFYCNIKDFTIKPEDKSIVDHFKREKEKLFMGKNARLHNELSELLSQNYWSVDYYQMKSIKEDMKALEDIKSKYNEALQKLSEYINKYPALSQKTIDIARQNFLYQYGYYVMQRYFNLIEENRISFDTPEYFKFIEKEFPLDNELDYTATKEFNDFIETYLSYINRQKSVTMPDGSIAIIYKPNIHKIWNQLINDGLVPDEDTGLEEETARIIEEIEKLPIDKRANSFTPDKQKKLDQLNKYFQLPQAKELLEKDLIANDLKTIDSVITNPILKELLTAGYFIEQLNQTQKPLSETALSILNARVTHDAFKSDILKQQNQYITIKEKGFIDFNSLKDVSAFKDFEDAKILLKELLKPYNGKVVYLDIWGTWCGPCRENMALMPDIEKELSGKDVIFMYLANNSPEDTWKSFIKKTGLSGENIVHYRLPDHQQRMIENLLSVSEYPSYFIFDKKGELIKMNAASPKFKNILLQQIEEALEKK
ncbi:TlpA family protein disulfide reductase [Coprobacter tertius]|uniref:TlpA family protein disulfide reductase n=1 Tax=Coprobacter tertius TaxID=2944915 RepID=A0ABT1MGB4_9BACT|nr:TlpA disulfide reductase family protein [Coprobacter tertius]MCP9611401.1 TlpA family protein disulfide reductase [Coprobacter tertius]